MLFHHKQRCIDSFIPDLSICGNAIDYVSTFNFLGLIIDEHISFEPHIQSVSNRISRSLGILNKLKRFLPHHILLMLYNSLILPHLQYSILCWGYKTTRLFKLQKRAMRIITCSKYNAHTDPIFKKLKLLKIADIYNICLLKFYYKFKKDNLPHYFRDIVSFSSGHQYFTRGQNKPNYTYCRTSHAKHSIRNYLPAFLNSTPNIITDKIDTHSLKGFSNYCKVYYISRYQDCCNIANCYVCSQQT